MIALLQSNPGLLIVVVILASFVLILSVIGLLMKLAGASLKPLWWFAGFVALIVVPQLIGHAIDAFMQGRPMSTTGDRPQASELAPKGESSANPLSTGFDYSDPRRLFGDRAVGTLVVDGRATASGLLHSTEDPKFFVLSTSETLLIGRFATQTHAEQAVATYLKEARIADRARRDSNGGYLIHRGPSDVVYVRAYGNIFTAWTGPSESVIEQLQIASRIRRANSGSPNLTSIVQVKSGSTDWTDIALRKATATWPGVAWVGVALGTYLLLVAAYFLKGIAWATRTDAKPIARALSAGELREQLTAINSLDVPFRVEPGRTDNELIAIWRYADAKWIDHARAHGIRRLHRVALELDETHRKVRATDYATNFDWSVGRGGANLEWKFVAGVVLFQYEHQRVFGLQLDPQGRFTPSLSYSYTFNLQEMKAPLVEAVTHSGWTWQPIVWNAPGWLKWLTE